MSPFVMPWTMYPTPALLGRLEAYAFVLGYQRSKQA